MSRIDSHKSSSPLLGARYIINIESDMHMFSNELKYLGVSRTGGFDSS